MALNMSNTVKAAVPTAVKKSAHQQFGKDLDSHLGIAPVTATTTVESKVAKEEYKLQTSQEETLVPGLFHTNGMKIGIEGSHTVNLGNFNSARIGVTVLIPCSPDSMNEAYEFGLAWVGERIQKEVAAAKGH